MNRGIVSVIMCVLWAVSVGANTQITGTKSETVVKNRYSKKSMYGESIVNIYAHWDRPYHIFLSPFHTTHIGTSHRIEKVINSYGNLLDVNLDDRGRYINIRSLDPSYMGKAPNIIILFSNGKSLLLNIECVSNNESNKANQMVFFHDAEEEGQYTKERFLQENERFSYEISKKEGINKQLLFNEIIRYEVGQTIRYKKQNSAIKLENISAIGEYLYYNLSIEGDMESLQIKDIVLEMEEKSPLFSLKKRDKTTQFPEEIIEFDSVGMSKKVSLKFNRNGTKNEFISVLRMGALFSFETQVNFLDYAVTNASMFETF